MSYTISDIAKKAGVSRSTVSRVLNGSEDVSEKTRSKVLQVIEEVGYIPSATAQSLSTQKSNLIGVVVPAVDNPFFGGILRGITQVLDKTEYIMMCYNTDDDFEKDIKALETLRKFRVGGLLYTPAIDYQEDYELDMLKYHLDAISAPTVLMDRKVERLSLDGVYFNDTKAVYETTKSLIRAGHTKIAFISGVKGTFLPRMREKGYKEALQEEGIQLCEDYLVHGDYDINISYKVSAKLLSGNNRPTAVITSNNMTTLSFLKALYERGESAPEDITYVSLDEISSLNIVDKSFNYIERDAIYMGRTAASLLLEKVEHEHKNAREIMLEAPVILRDI